MSTTTTTTTTQHFGIDAAWQRARYARRTWAEQAIGAAMTPETAHTPMPAHGPREVAELWTLRQARAAGVSAVAYQLSARRKLRDADAREAARYVASVMDEVA